MVESPTQPGEGAVEARLERWWRRTISATARKIQGAFPSLAGTVLAMQAEGLHSSGIPSLFSLDLREIDPSLNEDLLDLYGRSDQILESRFAFFSRLRRFEAEIDWEPPESVAWREELHAFDYAFDLALTWRISREEAYARRLRYLIAHWIASNPPVRGTGWSPPVLARRLRNWILAADLVRADWESDPVFLGVVTESLALQSTALLRQGLASCSAGERLDASRALLLASRLFTGARANEFRAAGLALLDRELRSCTQADGSLVEPWPGLQLHLVTTLLEWVRFDSTVPPEERLRPSLRSAFAALEATLLPAGLLPLFGPAAGHGEEQLSDAAALVALEFQEPRWKSLADKLGIVPYLLAGEEGKERFRQLQGKSWEADHCYQPRAKLYRISGTGRSALVVNAHSPGRPDDHQDLLSFELAIAGQRVIVDSGSYLPEEDAYFRSARAHNLLLVDDQGPRGTLPESNLLPPDPWESRPGLVRLTLSDPGYGFEGLRHRRTWFCLEGRCWGVVDFLEGQGVHRVASLLHFYPTFDIQVAERGAIARSRALTVTLLPLNVADAAFRATRGDAPEFPGWFAPDTGVKYPSGVLALESPQAQMPWVGGVLLVPGEYQGESSCRFDAATGELRLTFDAKQFSLHVG